MKTSSAKNKGRACCKAVQTLLYQNAPILQPGDIEVTSSGAVGEDLKLSPAARAIYPFTIECKNQESLNIWAAYEQSKEHIGDRVGTVPIVFYKRNRSELMVTMSAEDFIKLFRK